MAEPKNPTRQDRNGGTAANEIAGQIKELKAEIERHGARIKELEATASQREAVIDALTRRLDELERWAPSLDKEIAAATDAAFQAQTKADEAAERVKAIEKGLANGKAPAMPPLPRGRDLLSLDLRDIKLDPLALKSVAQLRVGLNANRQDVIDRIVKGGAGANIKRIARALSNRRLPDMSMVILDTVLHQLVHDQFGANIIEKETADTIGATSAILARFTASHGPLSDFAEILVAHTSEQLQLNMSPAQTQLMTERVYQSLI